MTKLNLSRVHFPVTTLGPGRRIGIWFQGCSLRCPGCISADTWTFGRGRTTTEAVFQFIAPWLEQADGITISGGEPFEQPDALLSLLGVIRTRFHGDILVYTGFEVADIKHSLEGSEGQIDALITGPYRHDLPQTLPLRGSDNQTLHMLTELGRERFARFNQPVEAAGPALDVMFDDDGTIWLAGIPRREEFNRLRAELQVAGHDLVLSADRSIKRDVETGDIVDAMPEMRK